MKLELYETIAKWSFIGAILAFILLLAVDKLVFGDIVPPEGTSGHLKPIVGIVSKGGYTDNELVNAIYMAEGGKNAKYPYGIRSVRCTGIDECRRVCQKTVLHGRSYCKVSSRWTRNDIHTFARHYCPTTGHLSRSEKRLNGNWVKNVQWFLDHPKKA